MFHFNRSLEGDFAANDMGRCDGAGAGGDGDGGSLETPELTVQHGITETEGGDEDKGGRYKNPNKI